MDWLGQKVSDSFWSMIFGFAQDLSTKALQLVTEYITADTDLNKITGFKVDRYVLYARILAAGLLLVAVAWEAFKQQSMNVLPSEEKSVVRLAAQTTVSGFMIFFLPWSVSNIFIKLNNLLINIITHMGVTIDNKIMYKNMGAGQSVELLGQTLIIMILILSIAFIVLGISAGIRYFDIMINYILSPIIAVSAVRNYDALNIWVREMTAVVFTQCIQILLLQLLMQIMLNMSGVMMYILCIGAIVVMLRGPKVLRQFLYSSGVGSSAVSAAGQAGRMGAMKIMMKSVK